MRFGAHIIRLRKRLSAAIMLTSGLLLASPVVALAQEHAAEEEKGNFIVQPKGGLMIWTLVVFFLTMWVLKRKALPAIQEFLDKRANAIKDSIEHAEKTRAEADEILAEYRERLKEAREQADDIVGRARKAGEAAQAEAAAAGKAKREQLVEAARADIEAETRRALERIRNEVADLTVLATEKVTRMKLTEDDQKKLVAEALEEIDFASLAPTNGGSEA
jgi:F-type H+-transporting ATPase subunit b